MGQPESGATAMVVEKETLPLAEAFSRESARANAEYEAKRDNQVELHAFKIWTAGLVGFLEKSE